jgi:lysozyme
MSLLSWFLKKLHKRKLGSVRIVAPSEPSPTNAPSATTPPSDMKKTPKFEQTNTIRASAKAYEIIKRWEGFREEPYLCSAQVPTIGYGSTIYPNGVKVSLQDPEITKAQAQQYLEYHVRTRIEPQLSELVGDLVNRNQYDALVSFIYNIGMGSKGDPNKAGFLHSTMLRLIKAGMLQAAANEFPRWNKSKGKVIAGLIARRKDEKALFEKDPNLD